MRLKRNRKITTKNVKHAKVQKRVYKLSTNVEFLEVAIINLLKSFSSLISSKIENPPLTALLEISSCKIK